MQFTDSFRKSSPTKLLPFRSPSPVLRGIKGSLELGREQVPHDISMLRQPRAVETTTPASRMGQSGLDHDARSLLTALELFSGLLAEPGVLSNEYKQFSGHLRSLAGPLSALVERMAGASHPQGDAVFERNLRGGAGASAGADVSAGTAHASGGEPVFAREPLHPALKSNDAVHRAALPGGPLNSKGEQARDAGVMVKSCEHLLGAMAGPGITLHISFERGVGELTMSGEALIRVLVNLVRNASESMPEGGRISITVRRGLGPSPSALLTVEDTGIGIPAHAMGQLFQAGFSSKKSPHAWPASAHRGLGLTIVRDLVEDAGGSVRVASALRKGSTFEIKLPCRRR